MVLEFWMTFFKTAKGLEGLVPFAVIVHVDGNYRFLEQDATVSDLFLLVPSPSSTPEENQSLAEGRSPSQSKE